MITVQQFGDDCAVFVTLGQQTAVLPERLVRRAERRLEVEVVACIGVPDRACVPERVE